MEGHKIYPCVKCIFILEYRQMSEDTSPPKTSEPQSQEEKKGSVFFAEILKFFAIVIFIIVPFRVFVAQPFIVEGSSMDPIFTNGQYLIVDQLTYHFEEPERGSVLIFKYPLDENQFFIKRVIGLPGETVKIRGSQVFIENEEIPKGFEYDQSFISFNKNDNTTLTLGNDEYFVLGDNRPVSSDSRAWGAVNKDEIIGRPILRLLPLSEIGVFPGDFSN